jgi:uncharacterized membrane protein YkoI
MQTRTKFIAAGAAVLALAAGGAGLALATGEGDDDGTEQPIQGSELKRASAVALDAVGGGQVTETEIRDEEGYYEVEVTRDDGSQVDVHLDSRFNVLDESGDGSGDSD